MRILAVYIAESAVIALLFSMSFHTLVRVMGVFRRGRQWRPSCWVRFPVVYLATLVLNVVGTTVWGAEFLLLYKSAAIATGVAFFLSIGSALIGFRHSAGRRESAN